MKTSTRPPFKADVVGSLLRLPEIHDARARKERGEISAAEQRQIESRCVEQAVVLQKSAGLKVCTDGDYHRRHWFIDFLEKVDGLAIRSGVPAKFHNEQGDIEFAPPRIEITGVLKRSMPLAVQDFIELRPLAERHGLVAKQTIPSPTLAHFRGGRAAIDEQAYPEIDQFFSDLAKVYREEIVALYDAGCRYLQIDETNLPFLCDPALRDFVRSIGEDPDALPHRYAKLLNDILASKPADLVVCMHLCRGNHQSSWVAEGVYDPIADVTFGGIDVDGFFLEYDTPVRVASLHCGISGATRRPCSAW